MPTEIPEEGRIYFFYRPRVGETEVDDLEDLQRLQMVPALVRTTVKGVKTRP